MTHYEEDDYYNESDNRNDSGREQPVSDKQNPTQFDMTRRFLAMKHQEISAGVWYPRHEAELYL